jgi:hypothetical protein
MPTGDITLRTKARGVTLYLFRSTAPAVIEVCWELRRGPNYRARLGGGFRGASKASIYVPDDDQDTLWLDGFCCQLASAAEAKRAIDWVAALQVGAPQEATHAAP